MVAPTLVGPYDLEVSVWRWIILVLLALVAPPLIARTAHAIALRERRKRECRHLMGHVHGLLRQELPGVPVESPSTPFTWFTEPELDSGLSAPNLFAYVLPDGQPSRQELDAIARYSTGMGARDLRIYVHDGTPVPAGALSVDGHDVQVHAVRGCPCGRGGPVLNANQ